MRQLTARSTRGKGGASLHTKLHTATTRSICPHSRLGAFLHRAANRAVSNERKDCMQSVLSQPSGHGMQVLLPPTGCMLRQYVLYVAFASLVSRCPSRCRQGCASYNSRRTGAPATIRCCIANLLGQVHTEPTIMHVWP